MRSIYLTMTVVFLLVIVLASGCARKPPEPSLVELYATWTYRALPDAGY